MYSKMTIQRIMAVILLTTLLTACSTATPTPATPTVDPKPTFDAVETQAAATVIANLTLTAPTATPVTPTATVTNTPLPTNTSMPTNTPLPPTATWVPWTLTPAQTSTPTTQPYSCTINDKSPSDNTEFDAGASFDGRWTVTNTGSQTWNAADYDLTYESGTDMHDGTKSYDLTSDVASGGSYTAVVDLKAPSSSGTYTTTYSIRGNGIVCAMSVTIKVK